MKGGKSPGCDGIPPEFFKLARTKRDEVIPSAPLGCYLLTLSNYIWRVGIIPSSWKEAHVVSIHKKGDPKDVDNYRGISLMTVGLKMITTMVNNRLRDHLEDREWFIRQQAGFRQREECAGHICSLYEMVRRRNIQGENTYVAFIDIQKAYDTVPIGAMLRKLELLGVHGNMIRFFTELYNEPKIRVRTKDGVSELIEQKRGLRQGCNASPLLFDIFINDILEECSQHGITIMGFPEEEREAGLLFADDLALLADSPEKLRLMLQAIQRWGQKYEMKFGVRKCGIMGFGPNAMMEVRDRSEWWILDNQCIPVVTEYMYLGIPIRSPIDLDVIVIDRAQKGNRCLQSIKPVISCTDIPLNIRTRLLRALLVPVLTYASELWGCSEKRAMPCQKVLSEAIRSLIRLRPRSTVTSSSTLALEFGIPSIHAVASSARVRAYCKFPSLRTTIAKLVRFPMVARGRTWVSGTATWLKTQRRYGLPDESRQDEWPAVIRDIIATVESQRRVGTLRYLESSFHESVAYSSKANRYAKYAKGIYFLTKFRVGAIWTAPRLATIGWLPEVYTHQCPCCNSGVPETYQHILTECTAWSEFRFEMVDFMGCSTPMILII
jgi:hypothetical protein